MLENYHGTYIDFIVEFCALTFTLINLPLVLLVVGATLYLGIISFIFYVLIIFRLNKLMMIMGYMRCALFCILYIVSVEYLVFYNSDLAPEECESSALGLSPAALKISRLFSTYTRLVSVLSTPRGC